MKVAKLELAEGRTFTFAIDERGDRALMTFRDANEELCFAAKDQITFAAPETSADAGGSGTARLWDGWDDGFPMPKRGRKVLFHQKSIIRSEADCVEVETVPVDARSHEPMDGLMMRYRFTPWQGGVLITAECLSDGPVYCQQLQWMQMQLPTGRFKRVRSLTPAYETSLEGLIHPLKATQLALEGDDGYALLCHCGEAVYMPDGLFGPQAGQADKVELSLFRGRRALGMVLVFSAEGKAQGVSAPSLPNVDECPPEGRLHELKCGRLRARWLVRQDGVSLLNVCVGNAGTARQDDLLPLMTLVVRELATNEERILTSNGGWGRVLAQPREDSFTVTLEEPQGLADFAVKIQAGAVGTDRIEWRAWVLNGNSGISVLSADYPPTVVADMGNCVLTPVHSGELHPDAHGRRLHVAGVYPTGVWMSIPMFAFYDEKQKQNNGFYAAVHDGRGARKDVSLECFESGESVLKIGCAAPWQGRGGNGFELYGRLVWQAFDGDWFDAARIYRAFVLSRAEWLPRHGRPDTPEWMKDVPLYLMDWMPNDNPDADPIPISIRPQKEPLPGEWYQKPIRLAKELGVPMGYHLYNWHWIPFNNDYPHYFPVKEGMLEGVKRMKEHGIHTMPYINGRLWDTRDRRGESWRYESEARPYTCQTRPGQADVETYAAHEPDGSLVRLAAMCPTSALWRNELAQISHRLLEECNVDAVYIDQVAAASMYLCNAPGHLHGPGNGSWWIEAYRLLMERLRGEAPEGCGFTTECNAETYTDQFDGFLTWMWVSHRLVPVFPAIYGGYIAMLGRNLNGYKKEDLTYFCYHMAQSVLFGQQLGWMNADVVEYPEKLAFLKPLAQFRYAYRDFFSQGELLRPPAVETQAEAYVTDTGMGYGDLSVCKTVLAGLWRKGHRALLMAANVGTQAEEVFVRFDLEEYGMENALLQQVMGGEWRRSGDGVRLWMEPRAFAAFEIVPDEE